jgi:putative ABC transport system ATP-binding protein
MIEVQGLVHRYGRADVLRLDRWRVAAGEDWAVIGPSGSGKSTLLHVLCGLVKPSAGRVAVAGVELSALAPAALDRFRAGAVGIVLQALHLVAHLSARDNVRLAQYLARRPLDDAAVDAAFAALGMQGKLERRPASLSQGERQRVAIARAVINRPRLLLADEPTASLDDAAAGRTIAMLRELAQVYGATLVVATHDARVKSMIPNQLDLGSA